ncbi:MAG: hypothetical protein ABI591_31610 [Kofleriaceae bacterium]
MRPTLPSIFGKICLVLALYGCHDDPPPVAAGEPIPAAAEISVDTMDVECAGLVAALDAYGECPNNEDNDKAWAKQVAEVAQQSFDAGKKGNPDEPSQHVIALACHRAAASMQHATERCRNGPRPKPDYGH